MPEDLARQIEPIHEAVRLLGWPVIELPGIEADDVIGTLAHAATRRGPSPSVHFADDEERGAGADAGAGPRQPRRRRRRAHTSSAFAACSEEESPHEQRVRRVQQDVDEVPAEGAEPEHRSVDREVERAERPPDVGLDPGVRRGGGGVREEPSGVAERLDRRVALDEAVVVVDEPARQARRVGRERDQRDEDRRRRQARAHVAADGAGGAESGAGGGIGRRREARPGAQSSSSAVGAQAPAPARRATISIGRPTWPSTRLETFSSRMVMATHGSRSSTRMESS